MTKDTPTPRVDGFAAAKYANSCAAASIGTAPGVSGYDESPEDAYLDAIDFARTLERDLSECRKENGILRGLLGNSSKPCPYCGLAAEDQSKCASGFPGCGRADDQMLSAHFAAGHDLAEANKELVGCRAAVRELVECKDLHDAIEAERYSLPPYSADCYARMGELERRKPLAWSAARAILAKGEGK